VGESFFKHPFKCEPDLLLFNHAVFENKPFAIMMFDFVTVVALVYNQPKPPRVLPLLVVVDQLGLLA
jgi:hypothetical protein